MCTEKSLHRCCGWGQSVGEFHASLQCIVTFESYLKIVENRWDSETTLGPGEAGWSSLKVQTLQNMCCSLRLTHHKTPKNIRIEMSLILYFLFTFLSFIKFLHLEGAANSKTAGAAAWQQSSQVPQPLLWTAGWGTWLTKRWSNSYDIENFNHQTTFLPCWRTLKLSNRHHTCQGRRCNRRWEI